jgi:integrase
MGRHISHAIKLRHVAGTRRKPFQLAWREWDAETGKRVPRSEFYATREEAELAKAQAESIAAAALTGDEARGGQHADDTLTTVRSFAKTWMDDHVMPRKKASTAEGYQRYLTHHILPVLGDCVLSDTTFAYPQVVKVVSAAAKKGRSWGTQRMAIRVLSLLSQEAVRYRHLTANPTLGVTKKLRPSTAVDPEPNPLTQAQADAFLVWVADQHPATYEYFLCLFRTGMRIGEAAALEWTALDRPKRTAQLLKNYSPAEKRRHPLGTGDITLKTNRPHEIDLSPELVIAVDALERRRKVEELKRGRKSPYVFLTPYGTRMVQGCQLINRVWRLGLTAIKADTKGHTLHDARDTFATAHLLRDPRRLGWISWMLGHRNINITLTRYIKFLPDSNVGAGYAADLDSLAARLHNGDGK